MRLGLGLGLDVGQLLWGGAAYTFVNAEAAALVARMTPPPNNTRKGQIDTLVGSLKSGGIWSKLDCFYVMAAHDAQAARRNWKADTFNLTPANSPTFTTDRGYTGDGSTSYLATGFNPTTAAGLFTQDSASIGVWVRSVSNLAFLMGTGSARIQNTANAPLTVAGRLNDATLSPIAGIADTGIITFSRTGSAGYSRYHDATSLGDLAAASTGLASGGIDILRLAASTFSNAQASAAFIGSGLTAGEVAALHSAIQTYLTAVGAA